MFIHPFIRHPWGCSSSYHSSSCPICHMPTFGGYYYIHRFPKKHTLLTPTSDQSCTSCWVPSTLGPFFPKKSPMPKNSINRIVEVAGVIFVLSTSALESWHPWTHRPNTSAYEVWVVQMIISYHILSYLFISIIHTQKNTSYPRPILWSLGVCP